MTHRKGRIREWLLATAVGVALAGALVQFALQVAP